MSHRIYFDRYAYKKILIDEPPTRKLGIVVTIPSYNEDSLITCLESIYDCSKPSCAVEVIVLINDALSSDHNIKNINTRSYREATDWANTHSSDRLRFHVRYIADIPDKHHGVGFVRKIAMDEAVRRFEQAHNHQGIIVGFDADCTCRTDYLQAIETHFLNHPDCPGASIYFEHETDGYDENTVHGINAYELHLRYLVNAQRFTGHKNIYQTVGSSMSVRSEAYMKQGGMNRRQAGEDFYFLNRIIALGNFMEINNTVVYPSPRTSDRVPFGTGKAMTAWAQNEYQLFETYSPGSFIDLKQFFEIIPALYESQLDSHLESIPESCKSYLYKDGFPDKVNEIRRNTSSPETFVKRLFNYFDAFKILKYLHYARDNFYSNVPVRDAAVWLLEARYNLCTTGSEDIGQLLNLYRQVDKESADIS